MGFLSNKHRTMWMPLALAIVLILYVLGIKLFFAPVIIALFTIFLPMPKLLASWFSRTLMAVLFLMVILQIAATFQFLITPDSNFQILAIFAAIASLLLLKIAPDQKPQKRPWLNQADICGLVVAVFFLLPFTPIITGNNTFFRIAEIGSIQAIDATNHYASVTEIGAAQHFTYKPGYYYPKGFYIAHSFIQGSIIGDQSKYSWKTNAVIYITDYVFYGIILALVMYYLVLSILEAMKTKLTRRDTVIAAICLGPSLSLYYLVPFVAQGFLNYYHVLSSIIAGSIFLIGYRSAMGKDGAFSIHTQNMGNWGLAAYVILAYGASVSWPLLTPPLLLVGLLFVLPDTLYPVRVIQNLFRWRSLIVLILFGLHLIPVYFQFKYSGADSSQGINLTGGLRAFHPLLLVAGVLAAVYVSQRDSFDAQFRKALANIFIGIGLFCAALIMLQYFTAGEVRYYAIKTSLLLELLILALLIALLAYHAGRTRINLKYMLVLPIVPLIVMVLLNSSVTNPLKDSRDLFRQASSTPKPQFFDHDVSVYTRLGSEGKIRDFNSTLVHYNSEQGKFYAHMQIPFWNNMMQYSAEDQAFESLHCIGALYSNLAFGNFTEEEQRTYVSKTRECAARAASAGREFYIVTDEASLPVVRATFGDVAQVVY